VSLLARLVDDAGLFPPTSLSMADALARHRSVSHPMLTGRFLVPGDRLAELSALLDAPLDVHVFGPSPFPQHPGAVEMIRVVAREGRAGADYLEGVAPADLPAGAFGKVRCAGISDEDLAAFIAEAAEHSRPFKATAGLHRAVRGWDGPGFHGYLNVLLAVAHELSGGKAIEAIRLDDPAALVEHVRALTAEQITAVRWLFHSYGSCDTVQPWTDAQELGLADL
jgi:hypothetical protein